MWQKVAHHGNLSTYGEINAHIHTRVQDDRTTCQKKKLHLRLLPVPNTSLPYHLRLPVSLSSTMVAERPRADCRPLRTAALCAHTHRAVNLHRSLFPFSFLVCLCSPPRRRQNKKREKKCRRKKTKKKHKTHIHGGARPLTTNDEKMSKRREGKTSQTTEGSGGRAGVRVREIGIHEGKGESGIQRRAHRKERGKGRRACVRPCAGKEHVSNTKLKRGKKISGTHINVCVCSLLVLLVAVRGGRKGDSERRLA